MEYRTFTGYGPRVVNHDTPRDPWLEEYMRSRLAELDAIADRRRYPRRTALLARVPKGR